MKKLNEIQLGLKAPKDQKNNFGNYKYRKAEDILAAVKPLLGEATLVLSDEIILITCDEERVARVGREDKVLRTGGRYFMKSTATISDGSETASATGWAEIDSHAGMSREQCAGAASSYARKYALCGLLGIDDSANDPDAIDNRPREMELTPIDAVGACYTVDDLARLWKTNPQWHQDKAIVAAFTKRKKEINGKN